MTVSQANIDLPADHNDLDLAFRLALEAGEILMEGLNRRHTVTRKGWRDLVSETDLAAEEAITRRLQEERPRDGIFAEESMRRDGESGRRWCVDPLDGTTNFVHGHPMFSVSIALEENGLSQLGVVWAPYLGELFWALRGRGGEAIYIPRRANVRSDHTWEGQRRKLAVTDTSELSDSLVATGFPYVQDERENDNLQNFNRVTLKARGVRRGGSAALDLAYVASGRFDGFWELYLNPWDVAAAALMVQEAGGDVTDVGEGDRWKTGWEIVATNGRIHEELRTCLKPADPK